MITEDKIKIQKRIIEHRVAKVTGFTKDIEVAKLNTEIAKERLEKAEEYLRVLETEIKDI